MNILISIFKVQHSGNVHFEEVTVEKNNKDGIQNDVAH